MEAPQFPDALRVPIGWRGTGARPHERSNTLFDAVEPLLGVGPGDAHATMLGHRNEIYVTRVAADHPLHSMNYPESHPLAKRPRYDWRPQAQLGKGVFFGYLKPDPYAEEPAANAPQA